jgi:hypothetical protein
MTPVRIGAEKQKETSQKPAMSKQARRLETGEGAKSSPIARSIAIDISPKRTSI